MESTARKVKQAIEVSGVLWWDDYLLKQIYSSAEDVGRMSAYDPTRVALQSSQHKGRQYLLSLQAELGQQCHGKRFHIWRWEKMCDQYFGEDWMQITLESDCWNDNLKSWLGWRRGAFNKQRRSHKENKLSLINALEG